MPAENKPATASAVSTVTSAVARARVLTERGDFSAPQRVSWAGGRFSLGGAADLDATQTDLVAPAGGDLWLVPGLVDAHTHASWHAFSEPDRARDTQAERDEKTLAVLETMLRAGFTSLRDAGGFDPAAFAEFVATRSAQNTELLPRVQASVHMITRPAADEAGDALALVDRALEAGARWIKLVGTASVASPPGSGLDPLFSLDEQRRIVRRAAEVGAGVMIHAWGGAAIDDAIEAGVMSVEHGIFLTEAQATRAADRGMTLVPTLRIYRLVQRMIERGELPAEFGPRVAEAVDAHWGAVRRARDAGLAIALGSDFGTSDQHGTNRVEFDDLVAAGLSPEEALVAATRGGAELLARVATDPAPIGRIADGEIADAMIFTQDPRTPGVFSAPDSIFAVVSGGTVISGTVIHDPHPRKDHP